MLYLLTDGDAVIPYSSIKAFNDNINLKRKIEFHANGFGRFADMKILKKIAEKMPNGKVSSALTVKELTESIMKIVLGDITIKTWLIAK